MRGRVRLGEGVKVRALHCGQPGKAAECHDAADQAAGAANDPGGLETVERFEDRRPREARGFLDRPHTRAAQPVRDA